MKKIVPIMTGGPQITKALGLDPDLVQRIIIDVDASKDYIRVYVKQAICDEEMCAICDLIKSWRENGLPSE